MMQKHYDILHIEWASQHGKTARKIRLEVFVDEQGVPREKEIDDIDPEAYHVIARDTRGKPCGTGRLYTDPDEPGTCHIGRMAVRAGARGTGCGSAIMEHLIDEARRRCYHRIVLSSQTHAIPFYEQFGFTPYGDEYLDCNIPHIDMSLHL